MRCAIPTTHTLFIHVNNERGKNVGRTYTIREPNSRDTVICRGADICSLRITGINSSATAQSVKIFKSKTGYHRTPFRLHLSALYAVVFGSLHCSGMPIPEKITHAAMTIMVICVARRSQIWGLRRSINRRTDSLARAITRIANTWFADVNYLAREWLKEGIKSGGYADLVVRFNAHVVKSSHASP